MYIGWIYNDHPMVTFVPTIINALLPRVPVVTLFEDRYGAHPKWIVARAVRKGFTRWAGQHNVDWEFGTLLRDSSRLIMVSGRTQAALAERFAGVNGKSLVIPCPSIMPISSEDEGKTRRLKRTSLGLKDDEFLIAYYGYMYPGKGVETLLRAFQKMNPVKKPIRLLLVGGTRSAYLDYRRMLYDLTKELGIEKKVIWTGDYAWDSEEASRCLRAADMCVLPFDSGICIHNSSLAGACAHRLPIITTEGPGMERLFIHGSNVFLCAPKNPEVLAQAMKTVIADPDLRERLRVGASELGEEWFSWQKAVTRTVEALKSETVVTETALFAGNELLKSN
jgi:glycosyltransferase involved in cell wall biosynthesis